MIKTIIRHILIVSIAILILVGVPLHAAGFGLGGDGVDAIATASAIIDQPSGAYVVWINRDYHPNESNLSTWEAFFSGEEIGFLFEDISCVVADGDTSGMELARSFQSRLPENQMKLRNENVTLMLSKAKHCRFDIVLMSREYYDMYGADALYNTDYMVEIRSDGK